MNGSDSAFPMVGGPQDILAEPWHVDGLTKREYIEIQMMVAVVSSGEEASTWSEAAELACRAADALIRVQKEGAP